MYTKKQAQTRHQLHNALLTLLETTRFDKITTQQLATAAGVTRSTFYRYYDDKYQLLEAVEEATITALVTMPAGPPNEVLLDQILMGYQAQFQALHALLGPNGDPAFATRLERRVHALFYPEAAAPVETVMMQVATTAMWLRLLQYWVFHSTTTPVSAVKAVTAKLMQLTKQW